MRHRPINQSAGQLNFTWIIIRQCFDRTQLRPEVTTLGGHRGLARQYLRVVFDSVFIQQLHRVCDIGLFVESEFQRVIINAQRKLHQLFVGFPLIPRRFDKLT